eukprot:TRINITY_DN4126_c0_g1_i9.p1 TRINITY_DN4126_c0_g1~~TRINITY_DN4126_c0_g1_i9.p1  ORF type:complete len:744 (+),score=122.21 TRINITY_DN4126_c0_g1_i9:83-2314(+)
MSVQVGTSITDGSTVSEPVPPELATLVGKVKDATKQVQSKVCDTATSSLLDDLNNLWMAAKGNDVVKGHIGDGLARELVTLAACDDIEIAISSAKLLRSITVNKKNKLTFQPMCLEILHILAKSTSILRIPLTATIWNLSSIRPNRDELMKDHVLELLAEIVIVPGELQGEAAGAIRNLTLDDVYLDCFAQTNMIGNLINVLNMLNIGPRVTCILNSIRNLSLKDSNHEKIVSGGVGITTLLNKLTMSADPLDQRYILETLSNLSKNESVIPFLSIPELKDVLLPFLTCSSEPLLNATHIVFDNLQVQISSRALATAISSKPADSYIQGFFNLDDNMLEKDIVLQRKIGEGAYGSVFLAEFNGYPVACKVIKTELTQENAKKILDELRVMKRLKHPNVVLFMGACINSNNQIMIVTEFAARGDLKRCLREVTSIAKRVDLAHDVATGLSWLQPYNIVHRDLKLENLLVSEDWTIKITDFGLSIELEDGASWDRFGGNIKYSAPEILKVKYSKDNKQYAYGEKTDVYSFGLLWWQILTKGDPFIPRPDKYKNKEGLASYILEGNRPPMATWWPKSLKTMIANCWSPSPSHRPTFRSILEAWDGLTMDLLCPDPLAKKVAEVLWKDQKTKPEYTTFKKIFIEKCMPTGKMKDKDAQTFEGLLRESAFEDTVSFSRFCYVIGWFGPLEVGCESFFSRMKDLISKRFFHGFVSNSKSDSLLTQHWQMTSEKKSYFLIKYSMESIGIS